MNKVHFVKSVLPLLFLTFVFFCIAFLFESQFTAFGDFVRLNFGLNGLFFSIFLLDYMIQPFPPDILVYSYLLSRSPLLFTVGLATLASVAGSCAGFVTGYILQYEGALKFIGKKNYDKAHELFLKHGVLAVIVAALTPIPFNVVCWCAGIFKMQFRYFLASVIVARVVRFSIVAWFAVSVGVL